MSKRIKRCFTNGSEVLHRWANQTQDSAYCKNVYFSEVKCYSYGSHYELGRLVDYKGVRVALINDSGYSTTTNKHIRWALGATSHLIHLRTKDLMNGLSETKLIQDAMIRLQDSIVNSIFDFFNSQKHWSEVVNWKFDKTSDYSIPSEVNKFNTYCDQLGFKDLKLDVDFDYLKELYAEHVQIRAIREAELKSPKNVEKRRLKAEKLEKQKQEKYLKQVELWKSCKGPLPESRYDSKIYLRIRNSMVETSKGASVPLSEALILLKRIESKEARNGDSIGPYSFNRVDSNGIVRIGCHAIELDEAKSVLRGAK